MKVFLFENLKINILLQFKNKTSSCVNQKCIHKWSQSFATPIPIAWDAASHSSQLCVIFILSWEIKCQTRLICLDCVCAEGDGAEIFSRQGAAAGEKWPLLRETGDNTFSLCTTATRQVALKQSLPLPPRRCIVFCQSLISACKREKSWRSQCECVHLIFWSAAFIVIASAWDFIRPYLSMLETVFVCKCLIHCRRLQYIKVLTPFTLTLSLSRLQSALCENLEETHLDVLIALAALHSCTFCTISHDPLSLRRRASSEAHSSPVRNRVSLNAAAGWPLHASANIDLPANGLPAESTSNGQIESCRARGKSTGKCNLQMFAYFYLQE